MAVSTNWFTQWTPPKPFYSDLTNNFNDFKKPFENDFKRQFDYPNADWLRFHNGKDFSLPVTKPIHHYDRYGYDKTPFRAYEYKRGKQNNYGYRIPDKKETDHDVKLAGFTLWLTLLGSVRGNSVTADIDTPPFNTLYKWQHIDFQFLSPTHRRHAITTGAFIPENVLPLGIDVWKSRVFITLPSWRRGVPATLATVSRTGGYPSPFLKPYPDWSFHRAYNGSTNNCTGLVSVFRIHADPCGRLWVLDSGQIDSQDNPKQLCPPSIAVFDLYNDKLIDRFIIPTQYVKEDSLFANLIVDTRNRDCSDLHLYIADTWRFGLLVFRHKDATFWRFSHHLFYPDPYASNFTVHGTNFQWTDGIFGLALGGIEPSGDRKLHFHALSSYRQTTVMTSVLRQPWRVNNSAYEFQLNGEDRGPQGQVSASAIDNNGVMFYGLVSKDSVGCWDTGKSYKQKNLEIIATNSETLIFPNDLKIDQEPRQSVWVISNRLPLFQAKKLKDDDYNYRIMYADTSEIVRGTMCDPNIPDFSTCLNCH